MKVAIAVHGRFHAFDLARGLHERGCLSQVATTYPAFAVRRFLPNEVRIKTIPRLEVWRRLHGKVPFVAEPDPGVSVAFGRFAAKTLPAEPDILVGWSSATLEAIEPAHARGAKVVLERGSTHILDQSRVLEEAYDALGLPFKPISQVIVERELEEYARADIIAVASRHVRETFIRHGVPSEKIFVNPYGADMARFEGEGRNKDPNDKPVILFVGQVGVRKGVPWLLRAFAPLKDKARLLIAGPVEAGFDAVMRKEPTENVAFLGPVSREALNGLYADADLFCLPSIEEGFGLVLLEAMAAGLPIVTTNVTGGSELVTDAGLGRLVPPSDAKGLAEALEELVGNRNLAREIGGAGRAHVHKSFTWTQYHDRAVAEYGRLIG